MGTVKLDKNGKESFKVVVVVVVVVKAHTKVGTAKLDKNGMERILSTMELKKYVVDYSSSRVGVVCRLSSVVCCLLSVVCRLSSVVCPQI